MARACSKLVWLLLSGVTRHYELDSSAKLVAQIVNRTIDARVMTLKKEEGFGRVIGIKSSSTHRERLCWNWFEQPPQQNYS
eukprot:5009120-Amphidinium_carterae.1